MFWGSFLLLATATSSAWASPASLEANDACKGNKPIDNFSQWANKTNSLGSVTGDDKSMTSIAVTGTTLSMTPKAGAYFYENLPCENAGGDGYNAIAFHLGGPAQSSLLLEIQTKVDCKADAHKSIFRNVTVPEKAALVTIPLADFVGANLAAITSLTFSTFNKTDGAYTLSDLEFVCGNK